MKGVAMLDVSGYHEVNNPIDQHRDMRLDVDHMSYEVSNRFLDYIAVSDLSDG